MAIASGALCNPISMVSFVSSNAYYGYVPLRTNEHLIVSSGISNNLTNNLSNGSPMETDDNDGHDYSAASCRLNNRYVIPEASTSRNWQEGHNDHHVHRNRREQQHEEQQQTTRARNRKRSSADLDQTLDQTTQLKRLREGGGNGRVYYGTGCAKDNGLATVHYESTSLHLNSIAGKTLESSSVVFKSCCWAAGNHSLICNPDYRHSLLSNGSETSESSLGLEDLLFETHGCSIYHHYRQQQFERNNIESEF